MLSRKIFCPMIHAELAWSWEKGRNNEDKVLESTFGITQSHQSNKYENMKKGNIIQRSRKIWNMKHCFWRNNKHYLSTVISQRKEKSRMEKGTILFLEPDFETLWSIVKSSMMMDMIVTKKVKILAFNSFSPYFFSSQNEANYFHFGKDIKALEDDV